MFYNNYSIVINRQKAFKKILIFLAVVLVFTAFFAFISLKNYVRADTDGTFNYTIADNKATVTGYIGEGGDVVIPDTLGGYPVVGIGVDAFRSCSSLTSITIPDGVTSIGVSAFQDCRSLTSITIPDSVTSIGHTAFYNCSSLASIIMPDGVTNIGPETFYNCSSLTSITMPNGLTSIGHEAFKGCSSLTGITIPNSVTSIDYGAFHTCTSLTSITIPDSVTIIYDSVFYGCSSLTSITIPDGVTSIGSNAFQNCSSLTSITIPDSVTSIDVVAFKGCSSLISIIIPDGITSIGRSMFYGCSSLTSITIPDSVTIIYDSVFYGCSSLTSITIPDSVTSISNIAFSNCNALSNAYFLGNAPTLGSNVFNSCAANFKVWYDMSKTGWTNPWYTYTTTFVPKAISSFTISNQFGATIIDEEANTIEVNMPYGTSATSLTPTIEITGASVSPNSGVPQDFTNPVIYTVTATDTTIQDYTVTVSVAANPVTLTYIAGAHGSISGSSTQIVVQNEDGTVVEAVPDNHYHFVSWSDSTTTNPRTDTNVIEDITVTASFAENATYTLAYIAGAHGSISGSSTQIIYSGDNGTAVEAVPDENYIFLNWSDSTTTNPRTDTNVTGNATLTASFVLAHPTLTYIAGTHGSITGSTTQIVDYGGSGTAVEAVPDENYHFVNWSDLSIDNPRTDTSVTEDITVTANFTENATYTLTYIAGDNGSIIGSTTQNVIWGEDGIAIEAVPDDNYFFVSWSDSTTTNPRTDTNVTDNITVTASFGLIHPILTYIAGDNGSIAGSSTQIVNYGEDGTAVEAVPDDNYFFVSWSDSTTTNPRTDTNVTDNITVTASFAYNYIDRYWVGGTGNWSDATNHWATSSGGNPNEDNLPTQYNNVFIDTSSGFNEGGEITIDIDPADCNNFTSISGHSYTVINNSGNIYIYGSAIFESDITFDLNSGAIIIFAATTEGHTITTNGASLAGAYFYNVGGGWTLQDDLDSYLLFFMNGTFDANDNNIAASIVYFYGVDESFSPTIIMGSGTWDIKNTIADEVMFLVYNFGGVTTIIPETSTIKLSGNPANFYSLYGPSLTYNNLWLANSGTSTFWVFGSSSFNDLKIDAGSTVTLLGGTTQTISSFTATGDPDNLIIFDIYPSFGRVATGHIIDAGSGYEINEQVIISNDLTNNAIINVDSIDEMGGITNFSLVEGGSLYEGEQSYSTIGGDNNATIFIDTITILPFYLSQSSSTVISDYLNLSNSNATGGAAWYAGANSLDTTNNEGWIFTDAPIIEDVIIAPTDFLGTVDSPTSITWSWTDNSDDEIGFKIHDDLHNIIATTTANATSFQETFLNPNTQYTRHVHAYNEEGDSDPSNSDSKYTSIDTSGFVAAIGFMPQTQTTTNQTTTNQTTTITTTTAFVATTAIYLQLIDLLNRLIQAYTELINMLKR